MSNKSILLAVCIFLILVAGMFVFAYLKRTEVASVTPSLDIPTVPAIDGYMVTRIEAKHFFINGVHTIVGEIPMPTPCDLLTADARVAESMPEQVTFAFTVINNSDACAQIITPGRFAIHATSSKAAPLSATFKGNPVELNLVEAAPGETPDEYELYTKG
jgi:hypothetical protein